MRCNSCGTQNEPDSRFCGGCGARLTGNTLAPTQKVVPDPLVQAAKPPSSLHKTSPMKPSSQSPAQPQPYAPAPSSAPRNDYTPPPQQRQPSGPQTMQKRPSSPAIPPHQAQPSLRPTPRPSGSPGTVQQRPQSSSATPRSGSRQPAAARSARGSALDRPIDVPKRRWGLIIIVLLLDLGLAGAGVYLLTEGLAYGDIPAAPTTKSGTVEPTPTPVAATPAGSPVPAQTTVKPVAEPPKPVVTKPAEGSGSAAPAEIKPIAAPPPAAGSGSAAPTAPTPTQGRKTKPKGKPAQPIDPYQEPPGPRLGPTPPPDPNPTGL